MQRHRSAGEPHTEIMSIDRRLSVANSNCLKSYSQRNFVAGTEAAVTPFASVEEFHSFALLPYTKVSQLPAEHQLLRILRGEVCRKLKDLNLDYSEERSSQNNAERQICGFPGLRGATPGPRCRFRNRRHSSESFQEEPAPGPRFACE